VQRGEMGEIIDELVRKICQALHPVEVARD